MPINEYMQQVIKRYKSGISKEHSYRGDLENLLRDITTGVEITNEPSNVTDCGNPDYVITKGKIPIGYIEAKDVGKDLNSKQFVEQFTRYKKALDNLIITDYLYFQFFKFGELVYEIRIGEIQGSKIIPLVDNYDNFQNAIKDFCNFIGQTIKSSKKLAEMMASKAKLLENIIEAAILSDENTQENTSLKEQYDSFKKILIHELKPKEFSDVYAQTLAYGMFAARLHDTTLDDFSRKEAAELIPQTNPFLRKLFQYIAGYDIDERIKTTVDNLADLFRATDISALLNNFGKSTQSTDPIIHFYETFLAEYDPNLRKSRGVYYTPEPVVNFIVRAVDFILKEIFNLPKGISDITKTTIKREMQGAAITKGKNKGKPIIEEVEVHKVQILDPAAGTGTFLSETIKHIYNNYFGNMQGAWNGYVEEHLIPRINGFELLMASYSMAHLKLDLLLSDTNFQPQKKQRLNIYLTNSLEEYHPDTGNLWASWLSSEANEANHIKRDTPVMCVIGNPPYSGISINKDPWITELIEDYKYVDGVHFGERKHWLQDDYVKFIRFGEYYINKNGEGVLAFINNHSYIDNPTFKGMRWHLLNTFDKIYILDLHGSSKKKEKCPDGSKDENVFDITAGVSINIFIKNNNSVNTKLAEVFHSDLYGKRDYKYSYLWENDLKSINFEKIEPKEPYYFFKPRDYKDKESYEKGFSVNDLFMVSSVGFVSANDGLNISFTKDEQIKKINDLKTMEESAWRVKYKRKKDSRDWTYKTALADASQNFNKANLNQVTYRPFDIRWTCYTGNSRGLYSSPQPKVMRNFLYGENIGLITARSNKSDSCDHFFISNKISEAKCGERTTQSALFPLYIYSDDQNENTLIKPSRSLNLKKEIINLISDKLSMSFIEGDNPFVASSDKNTFTPIDVFDYIYSILHSTSYREKYYEYLKVDFPIIPFPDKDTFKDLVLLGNKLRTIHLFQNSVLNEIVISFNISGSDIVEDVKYDNGLVYINKEQYFESIPENIWKFIIGGYQPAERWLKERKGRVLTFEDKENYNKIIIALSETEKIMNEIDEVIEF